MEGMGIWIFLLLFYLLQALVKRKRKQRLQETEEKSPEPQTDTPPHPSSEPQRGKTTQKPQRPVSLEDLFNPEKLRDMLGVPQPEPIEKPEPKPVPQPVAMRKTKSEIHKRWEEPQKHKPSLHHELEIRETGSRVASADITDVDESAAKFKSSRLGKSDITDVDESAADFKSHRLVKSDITSDRFDERKEAPGKKKKAYALEYFDEPEDIRNAVILKEILDRPRAFRRNIR